MEITKITKLEGQDGKKEDDKLYEIESSETRKRVTSLAILKRQKTHLEEELTQINAQIAEVEKQKPAA